METEGSLPQTPFLRSTIILSYYDEIGMNYHNVEKEQILLI